MLGNTQAMMKALWHNGIVRRSLSSTAKAAALLHLERAANKLSLPGNSLFNAYTGARLVQRGPVIGIDTEGRATRRKPENNLSLGAAVYYNGEPVGQFEVVHYSRVNGDAVPKVKFPQLAPNFLTFLSLYPSVPVYAHNLSYDKRMLSHAFFHAQGRLRRVSMQGLQALNLPPKYASKYPLLPEPNPLFCSLLLARFIRPQCTGLDNSLDGLCRYYGIDLSSRDNGHGALIDAHLLLLMLPHLIEQFLSYCEAAGVLTTLDAEVAAFECELATFNEVILTKK